jgi:hypothetical protein
MEIFFSLIGPLFILLSLSWIRVAGAGQLNFVRADFIAGIMLVGSGCVVAERLYHQSLASITLGVLWVGALLTVVLSRSWLLKRYWYTGTQYELNQFGGEVCMANLVLRRCGSFFILREQTGTTPSILPVVIRCEKAES